MLKHRGDIIILSVLANRTDGKSQKQTARSLAVFSTRNHPVTGTKKVPVHMMNKGFQYFVTGSNTCNRQKKPN